MLSLRPAALLVMRFRSRMRPSLRLLSTNSLSTCKYNCEDETTHHAGASGLRGLHLQQHFGRRLRVPEELDSCACALVFCSKPRNAVGDHAATGAAGGESVMRRQKRRKVTGATAGKWLPFLLFGVQGPRALTPLLGVLIVANVAADGVTRKQSCSSQRVT